MKVRVLKSFQYSKDGISNVTLNKGDEPDIADDLIEGLHAAGYIDDGEGLEAGDVSVEIPEGWVKLPWFTLAKLAGTIKGGKVANKAEAVELIEAELTRRAG